MSRRAEPILSLAHASFRFGEDIIFADTTWFWRRGEQWAVVGPNGSGKTLFAAAIRGFMPLVSGEMEYHFRPEEGSSPEESIAEVCFSDRKLELMEAAAQSRWFSLDEEASMRVADLLSYERVMEVNPYEVTQRHKKGLKNFVRRKKHAIQLLSLEPLLSQSVLSLSNGESQRVQLAKALCRPLRLLILDEPWLGLDAEMRRRLDDLVKSLMHKLPVLILTSSEEHLPRDVTHVLRLEHCSIVGAETWHTQASARSIGKPRVKGANLRENANGSASRHVLLQMRDVSVRYGSRVILHRLSWTVRRGESWTVLGPNGSGKSTLLSLILGDHPQAYINDILIAGKKLGEDENVQERKCRIGWVAPELQLHFRGTTTCFETVACGFKDTIGLYEELTPRQEAQVRGWLKRFGLASHAETPFAALSAGCQRAALLARALVKKPSILLLDEPCQGLDTAHRATFLALVEQLVTAGTTSVVYVTHRPEEIPPSIRRSLLL